MSHPIRRAPATTEAAEGAEIPGSIDDHRIARIDEAARQEVQSLLRAGNHEDVLRLSAEAFRDGRSKPWLPLCRAQLERNGRFAGENRVDRAPKRVGRKALERRRSSGE